MYYFSPHGKVNFDTAVQLNEAYQHQLASRPAGAVMIFTHSRNAATGDNSMYCMIPDPFPSTAFDKGSATPDYCSSEVLLLVSSGAAW